VPFGAGAEDGRAQHAGPQPLYDGVERESALGQACPSASVFGPRPWFFSSGMSARSPSQPSFTAGRGRTYEERASHRPHSVVPLPLAADHRQVALEAPRRARTTGGGIRYASCAGEGFITFDRRPSA
jgi:hypothetical protein